MQTRFESAIVVSILLCVFSRSSNAQSLQHADHEIIFEIGAVLDGDPDEGTVHRGGTFAFEVTPIERWLELEIGISAIAAEHGAEIPIDVLFKKPWPISPTFEFMVGAGPEIIRAAGSNGTTYWGVSAVLDFMFWPRRNVGWYVEPGYEATFRDGTTHHGYAIAFGLLLGR